MTHINATIDEIARDLKVGVPKAADPGAPVGKVYEVALSMLRSYAERMTDALAMYRPVSQAAQDFHSSRSYCRLVSAGNQAGKTLCTAVEVSRIARGMDPFKKRGDRDLRILVCGLDEMHIASVIWKKMWFPGAFSVVKDEITGLWRAVRADPNDPTEIDPIDRDREKDWMPSPPLLPPSCLKAVAWNRKNMSIPKTATLTNGTEIMFYSSKGSPRQGIDVDLFWCDEELMNKAWITESQARLLRRAGIMIASYTPQASTPEYFDLHRKAAEGKGGIEEFSLSLEANPYIPRAAKKQLYDALKHDPDELAVRYYGKYAIKGRQCYPEFAKGMHCVDDFPIPDDWMKVVAIDPGARFQTCVYMAIDPECEKAHVYDETHMEGGNARLLAEEIKNKLGDTKAEVFIIDYRGGIQRPMGYSNTVADHYQTEFENIGLESRLSGSGFVYGSDNVSGREHSLKRWMRPGESAPPVIAFHRDSTRKSQDQLINRYYSKTDASKREERVVHDLVDVLEYACAYFDICIGKNPSGLYYEAPDRVDPRLSKTFKAYKELDKFFKDTERQTATGGISLG